MFKEPPIWKICLGSAWSDSLQNNFEIWLSPRIRTRIQKCFRVWIRGSYGADSWKKTRGQKYCATVPLKVGDPYNVCPHQRVIGIIQYKTSWGTIIVVFSYQYETDRMPDSPANTYIYIHLYCIYIRWWWSVFNQLKFHTSGVYFSVQTAVNCLMWHFLFDRAFSEACFQVKSSRYCPWLKWKHDSLKAPLEKSSNYYRQVILSHMLLDMYSTTIKTGISETVPRQKDFVWGQRNFVRWSNFLLLAQRNWPQGRNQSLGGDIVD